MRTNPYLPVEDYAPHRLDLTPYPTLDELAEAPLVDHPLTAAVRAKADLLHIACAVVACWLLAIVAGACVVITAKGGM